MMRIVIGWLIAAALMFAVGFGFYATPLNETAISRTSAATGASVQAALRGLTHDGYFMIPGPAAADAAGRVDGPIAMIHVRRGGGLMFDPLTIAKGFVHYLVVAALLGLVLGGVPRGLRTRVALYVAGIAVVFIHLGQAIWWSFNWQTMAYFAVADFATIAAGGLVMAYWLRRQT